MTEYTENKPVRILVSGFGPFPKRPVNPSSQLVGHLAEHFNNHSDIRLESLVLTTAFNSAYQELLQKIESFRPDIVIAFGVSARVQGFDIESTARNQLENREDAQGNRMNEKVILPEGTRTLRSNLPLRPMKDGLQKAGVPARISKSAGRYLCNYLFYKLMHDIYNGKLICKGGFVHIPYDEAAALHYGGKRKLSPMPKKIIDQGGVIIVETVARHFKKTMS